MRRCRRSEAHEPCELRTVCLPRSSTTARSVSLYFFTISGFVLAMPFIQRRIHADRGGDLGRYYLRRLVRIEPPYIVAMVLAFLAAHAVAGGRASPASAPRSATSISPCSETQALRMLRRGRWKSRCSGISSCLSRARPAPRIQAPTLVDDRSPVRGRPPLSDRGWEYVGAIVHLPALMVAVLPGGVAAGGRHAHRRSSRSSTRWSVGSRVVGWVATSPRHNGVVAPRDARRTVAHHGVVRRGDARTPDRAGAADSCPGCHRDDVLLHLSLALPNLHTRPTCGRPRSRRTIRNPVPLLVPACDPCNIVCRCGVLPPR